MSRRTAALLALLTACGGTGEPSLDGGITLRVSASHDLPPFVPGPRTAGSSAYALDLAYLPLADHVSVIERDGTRVVVRRRGDSPYALVELADSLRWVGLEEVRVLGDEQIALRFSDDVTAAVFAGRPEFPAFALGPYRAVRQDASSLVLESVGPSVTIPRIEIVAVPAAQQWRRLMARDVDVVPFQAARHREQFAGMQSVRLIELPYTADAAVFINAAAGVFQAAEQRARFAAAIDRPAVARETIGDPSAASTVFGSDYHRSPPKKSEMPSTRIRMVTLESDSEGGIAAAVIRHQLRRDGFEIEIEPLPIEELSERSRGRDFDVALARLPVDRRFALSMFHSRHSMNILGYADSELDRLIDAGDEARAMARLAELDFVVPLYRDIQFAAVDDRFCGGNPKSAVSWDWLAELYLCEEGER